MPDACATHTGGSFFISVTLPVFEDETETVIFFLPRAEPAWEAATRSVVLQYLETCDREFRNCVHDRHNEASGGALDLSAIAECVLDGVRSANPGYASTRSVVVARTNVAEALIGGGIVRTTAISLSRQQNAGTAFPVQAPYGIRLFLLPPIP